MGKIIVEVMPKPQILDPQGKAIKGALDRLGLSEFTQVRQGKLFELSCDGPVNEQTLQAARQAAETLLSNPVIEDIVCIREQS